MAVAFDAATESVRTATTDPYTFSHTGRAAASGGVQGVLVFIIANITSADEVAGVTYGGVALSEVVRASDTAGEPGDVQAWFYGGGLPGGSQTVSVDFTSATTIDHHITCVTLTGDSRLEVVDSDEVNENVADPSVTLSYGGRTCITVGALFTGFAQPSSAVVLSGMTAVHDHDLGSQATRVDRQTTPGTSDFTFGYTMATDDVAMVAVAVSEIVAPTAISYIAASSNGGNSTGPSLVLPSTIAPGDGILVFFVCNNGTVTATPSGYTAVGPASDGNAVTNAFYRVADGSEAGATLSWTMSATTRWATGAAVYQGVDDTKFPERNNSSVEGSVDATHNSPSITVDTANSWVVGAVLERGGATATTAYTAPGAFTKRTERYESGGGPIALAIGDTNTGLSTGANGPWTWTADQTSDTVVGWSLTVPPIVSTTPVNKDLVLLWNVRAAVGKSLVQLWHTRANVTRSLITRWNVATSVTRSLITRWNVTTSVGRAYIYRWNVRAAVGPSLVVRWNVRAAINRTLTLPWKVATSVGRPYVYRWAVRQAVGSSDTYLWNTRAAVGRTYIYRWNVRAAVTRSLITRWNVRSLVTRSVQTLWNVRSLVTRSVQTLWNVRQAVGRSTSLLWNVLSPLASVGRNLVTLWNTRAAVGSSDTYLWNVRAAVGRAYIYRWNVRAAIGRTYIYRWNVRQAVGRAYVYRWSVRALATRSLQTLWNVRQSINRTLTARWAVRSLVTRSVQTLWNVRAAVGQSLVTLWDVLANGLTAGRDLVLRYNVRAAVGRNVITRWNVRALVTRSVQTVWNVRQVVRSKNLLTYAQATFEGGTAPNWTTSNNTLIEPSQDTALEGSWSLKITKAVSNGHINAFINVPGIVEGRTYTFVGDMTAESVPDTGNVIILWLNSVGGSVGQSTSIGYSLTPGTWQHMTVTGVAPARAVTARCYFYVSLAGVNTVYYGDAAGLWEGTSTDWEAPGPDLTARWSVRALVTRSVITRWNVRAAVGRALTAAWDVLGLNVDLPWLRFSIGGSSASRDESTTGVTSRDEPNSGATARDEASSTTTRFGG